MTLLLNTGEPAKAGDRVWRVLAGYASVMQTTVQAAWVTVWSASISGHLFTTEQAAIAFAIKECRARLAKARKESKREARAIERLEERMREL